MNTWYVVLFVILEIITMIGFWHIGYIFGYKDGLNYMRDVKGGK